MNERITDQQRRNGEHRHANLEHASPPIQVAQPPAEQQQAAEGEDVGIDDPGQARSRDTEVVLERRQGNVRDRVVEHDYEL